MMQVDLPTIDLGKPRLIDTAISIRGHYTFYVIGSSRILSVKVKFEHDTFMVEWGGIWNIRFDRQVTM